MVDTPDIPSQTVEELTNLTPEAYIEQITETLTNEIFDDPQLELPLESRE
jgi:hypothetical protein